VIQDATGKREEIEITREDNAENAGELAGSVIADGETDTPAVESAR
jgi:hypothetical protein